MYFYEKPLDTLTEDEWEQICMKCGKCCMYKFSDDLVIHFSNCMCNLFDMKKGLCSCYDKRFKVAGEECQKISLELLKNEPDLLPPECAYRRLYEGRGLPSYHPLLTGDPNSVIKAKKTVAFLPVFSKRAEEKEVEDLLFKATQERLSAADFKRELASISKKFKLKWLETYPLVQKPTT